MKPAQDHSFPEPLSAILKRHLTGDWRDLGDKGKQANEDALKHGDRLEPKYEITPGTALLIITEYDRSVTTLLCREEY